MTPPARRPPPLLVMAAAGLVVVLGAGVLLIATRGGEHEMRERGEPVFVPAAEPTKASAPAAERSDESRTRTRTETGTGGAADEELPIWARPPRVTVQPFPEGARFDPPMPPVKIPPEMLVPPAPPDAANGGAR